MVRALAILLALLFTMHAAAAAEAGQGWVFRGAAMDEIPPPGVRPCRATWEGETVNTRLVRTRDDRLVLIASWHSWDHTGYPIPGTLSIDQGEPVAVSGYSIGPLYMVRIDDDPLYQAVREARRLHWQLPWGEFTTEIEGLGAAFDAIDACPG